jgi:hypothetical protein
MRRTLGATVLTYAFALLATVGLPILLLAVLPVIGLFSYTASPPLMVIIVLYYVFGLLIVTNPIATAITTEVILVGDHTVFYFTVPVSSPVTGSIINLPMISPWLPFTLFCLALGAGLILLSIQVVRRAER